MEGLGMMPNYLSFGHYQLSQTLITAFVTTALFLLFVFLYNILKKINPKNGFVLFCEMFIEGVASFIESVGGHHFPVYGKNMAIFFFVYLFWNNILGVIGDMFALVVPSIHHYFRPATTDITFNAILAVVGVGGSIVYGLQHSGINYLNKYFPLKGLGIVPKVDSVLTGFLKIFDILLGLFIGLLELIGEFARMISLSLRLFGNILAGMVLLGLGITGAIAIFKVPFLLPIVVFLVELFVGFLQAFVFTLLVVVYFKMAGESH